MARNGLSQLTDASCRPSEFVYLCRLAANLSEQMGDTRSAIDYYERARVRQPMEPYVYVMLADLYESIGDTQTAFEQRKMFLTLASPDHDAALIDKVRTKLSGSDSGKV